MGIQGIILGSVLAVDAMCGTGGAGFRRVAPWLGFGSVSSEGGSQAAVAIEDGSQAAAAIEDGSQAAAAPQSDTGNLVAGSIISKLTAAAMSAAATGEDKKMGLLAAIAVNVVGGAVIYGTGGLGVGLVAPWLGFGSAGIAGGSLAAAAQSYSGNLVAGSIISKLTAAAMVAPTP